MVHKGYIVIKIINTFFRSLNIKLKVGAGTWIFLFWNKNSLAIAVLHYFLWKRKTLEFILLTNRIVQGFNWDIQVIQPVDIFFKTAQTLNEEVIKEWKLLRKIKFIKAQLILLQFFRDALR